MLDDAAPCDMLTFVFSSSGALYSYVDYLEKHKGKGTHQLLPTHDPKVRLWSHMHMVHVWGLY